ncbi:hypothetical protein ABH908_000330 [Pseudomonas frederiksbergensis]|uniref:hypothetical protein n=1 Tax=Pseudomonas TaxID=286 RepID=UPI003D19BE89
MKRLPHTKLSKFEFIMLRSLAKSAWLSVDPVLWRHNRSWRFGWFRTEEARVAAESLLRRGLVTSEQLTGFSPLRPGEPVKWYWINDRGTALLNKANGIQPVMPAYFRVPNPQLEQSRLQVSFWWRILRSIRRRRADVDTARQSSQQAR